MPRSPATNHGTSTGTRCTPAVRHGIVMARVTQRSIHFGAGGDARRSDELVMHRPTLERMRDGTYWSDL